MNTDTPTIIITGASGFIGRYFMNFVKEHYQVIAIARRSSKEAGIPYHPNIHWIQWDIGSKVQLKEVFDTIQKRGGADYLLHLAAFYDFDYSDNAAYQRTNVEGTVNVVELARQLKIKRFIFASSLAACLFPPPGKVVNEASTLDADYAYAKTKKFGEELLRKSSGDFPCSVVRFAAVFSDLCENPPLYKFLGTWLSRNYNSRILGGKGESAVPYISIHELVKLLLNIIQQSPKLPSFDIYAASPDGCTSHAELFRIATRDYFGEAVKPVHIPKWIAYPALLVRTMIGRIGFTPMPFERFWMLRYLDLKLTVDSSYTRKALGWEPSSRHLIEHRLLFLLARMKSNPVEWNTKNEAALKHISIRVNLLIYEIMITDKENILTKINARILSLENIVKFKDYQKKPVDDFRLLTSTTYNLLASTVYSSDRNLMITYMEDIAIARFNEGFQAKEICDMLDVFKEIVTQHLLNLNDYKFSRQDLYDYIGITLQLAKDEIEEKFEGFELDTSPETITHKVKLKIDGIDINVEDGTSILDAARQFSINIPTLCYHKDLMIAGNCRVCLVEEQHSKQLIASCSSPVEEGMEIHTNSIKVRSARRTMIDLLLSEHNADCTKCYKNGKCELQALASEFKIIKPLFLDLVRDKKYTIDDLSPSIVKDDSKCIRCQRCIRTCSQIQGVSAVSAAFKGPDMKISTYFGRPLFEVICTNCGQCIDRCPTGALVEKNYIEEVWTSIFDPSKHVVVQTAPAVRIAIGEDLGIEPGKRVTGKLVTALRRLGFDSVLDTAFSADLTIMEEGNEFLDRLVRKVLFDDPKAFLPMTTSCSPGWIKYLEQTFPELIPNVSTCKSPQQMFGVLAKTYYAKKMVLKPENIVTVSIMPCTAKKFEADRPEMRASGYKDVDYVLTTRELAIMINQAGMDFESLPNDSYDSIMGKGTGAGVIFGATGGVMEATLRTVYEKVTGREIPFANLVVTPVRGLQGVREASLLIENPLPDWSFLDGIELKVAIAHGLANARTVMQSVKNGTSGYHFIEIMSCPGGCLGGGGQPIPTNPEIREKRLQALYAEEMGMEIRKSHENPEVLALYEEFLEEPLSEKAHELLHTHYHERVVY